MRDRSKDDPRIDPLLLDTLELLAKYVPKDIEDFLLERLGHGGLIYAEWDRLIALGLAEYYEKDNGAMAHTTTRLGNVLTQALFRRRHEEDLRAEEAEVAE